MESNIRKNARCETRLECLIIIARSRKELLPLRLVKALHAADNLGLVDKTPLGIWLPTHILSGFSTEDRKTPSITLLRRLYSAELAIDASREDLELYQKDPGGMCDRNSGNAPSSSRQDGNNTFRSFGTALESWLNDLNTSIVPLSSGLASVSGAELGNVSEVDMKQKHLRPWGGSGGSSRSQGADTSSDAMIIMGAARDMPVRVESTAEILHEDAVTTRPDMNTEASQEALADLTDQIMTPKNAPILNRRRLDVTAVLSYDSGITKQGNDENRHSFNATSDVVAPSLSDDLSPAREEGTALFTASHSEGALQPQP